MSFNRWVVKTSLDPPYHGILLSMKSTLNESPENYAKKKKFQKGYKVYSSIYVTSLD